MTMPTPHDIAKMEALMDDENVQRRIAAVVDLLGDDIDVDTRRLVASRIAYDDDLRLALARLASARLQTTVKMAMAARQEHS